MAEQPHPSVSDDTLSSGASCVECDRARRRAKDEGHRNWRDGWVCYDHAAFSLDSPKGRALFAFMDTPEGNQLSLF